MSLRKAEVTVIVPIYNVEKYLETCFKSLLNQTSNDFIVYAVNDGSPDNSLNIIKDYEKRYPEIIKVIDKENGGYGSVLELSISILETDYFLVLDPDDSLKDNAIELLLKTAKEKDGDIIIGAKNYIYENSDEINYHPAYTSSHVQLKDNYIYQKGNQEFNDLYFIDPSPHAKLYKKEISKNIIFPKKVSYTDSTLFFLSLLNAKRVIYIKEALANYLIDRTGNTMTDISMKAIDNQILVFSDILRQANEINNVDKMFYYRMFEAFKYIQRESKKTNCSIEEYENLLERMKDFAQYFTNHYEDILPLYNQYNKYAFLERRRDKRLLNPKTFEKTYKDIKERMLIEFRPKK